MDFKALINLKLTLWVSEGRCGYTIILPYFPVTISSCLVEYIHWDYFLFLLIFVICFISSAVIGLFVNESLIIIDDLLLVGYLSLQKYANEVNCNEWLNIEGFLVYFIKCLSLFDSCITVEFYILS